MKNNDFTHAKLNPIQDFHLNKCLLSHHLPTLIEPTDESPLHWQDYELGVCGDIPGKNHKRRSEIQKHTLGVAKENETEIFETELRRA